MGIGLCVIVPEEETSRAMEIAKRNGSEIHKIGFVVEDQNRRVRVEKFGICGSRGVGFAAAD